MSLFSLFLRAEMVMVSFVCVFQRCFNYVRHECHGFLVKFKANILLLARHFLDIVLLALRYVAVVVSRGA